MNLEHGLGDLCAKWNPIKNTYDIGQKTKYRWKTNITDEAMSDWFTDISDALEWIIDYDRENASI